MKRTVYIIVIILLLIPVSGFIYISSTSHGLKWVLTIAGDALPGRLSIDTISGRLVGPLMLSNVRYSDDEQSVAVDSFSMDWKPLRLLFLQFHLIDMSASGIRVERGESSAPAGQSEGLPDIRLPLDIRVDSLLVRDLSIYQSGASSPFTVKEIRLQGAMDKENVRIEKFSVLSEEFALSLHGTMKPEGDYPLNIQTDWNVRPEGYAEIAGAGELSGTMKVLKIRQEVNTPFSARLDASLYDLLKELQWEGTISLSNLALQKINGTWPDIGVILQAQSTGTVSSFIIGGTADLSDKQYGTISGAFSILKDNDTWLVKNLHLSIPGSEAAADLSGRYSQVDSAVSFQSEAKWNSLSWPLTGNEPDVISRGGIFTIKGAPDDYGFSLTADIAGKQIPHSDVKVKGTGTQESIMVKSLYAKLLDGELTGDGTVRWKPSLDWQVSLQGDSVNPGAHWPEWPGKLNMKTAAKGGIKDGELIMSLEGASVQGELRGYPFSAEALFDMAGSIYRLHRFEMSSGSAHLTASGSYGNKWDAQWSVRIPALGEFYPGGKGEIHGQGHMKGETRRPEVIAVVKGSGLSLESYRAAGLTVNIDIDISDREDSLIDFSAEDILVNAQDIKQFMLKAEGKISSHILHLSAGTEKESIRLSADAGYTDEVWTGSLTRSELDLADYGQWTLKEKGAFSLSSKTARTDNLCWTYDSASVCLQTAWNDTEGFTGNTGLSDIPLSLFRPLIPAGITVNGLLQGDGDISFSNERIYGHTSIAVTGGSVSYPSEKNGPVTLLFEEAAFEGVLNEKALDVQGEVSLKERGHLKGTLNLPRFTPLDINREVQAVSGRITGELEILDLVPRFTDSIENSEGIILSELGISGTLARPDVTGYMKLQGSQAGIPGLGLHLKDINVDVTARENRAVHVEGKLSSGSGEIMLQGDIYAAEPDKVNAELHIKGDHFETVKVPELSVVASPDINVRLQDTAITVEGTLSIPEAFIEPPDLSEAVPVSKDVYIVSGNTGEEAEEKWKISSRIKLALGDNVRFNGYGLTCRISGSMGLTDEPGRATAAEGELQILDGQYKSYGQDLTIEKGRLLFVGLIDDPGLDIRAVRQIKDVRAGVRVAGTLKAPEMSVFSVPSMDQSDALSYILFGKPMSGLSGSQGGQLYNTAASAGLSGGGLIAKKVGAAFGLEDVEIEKGDTLEQSALVIGKYLSPKLYVSYGIGLFEPINTLRMRYNLSPRWLLQTEYGIESGGDVIYKIER